ncbi:MAG: metal ABC transporter substrate-binding protein, partial [Verrucomicrobiales bacterium]
MTRFYERLLIIAMLLLATTIDAKIKIVATTPDLGALAEAIGGDEVSVTLLAKATEDPHFVDARPSFMVQLSKADLLVEGGADLEAAWLLPLVQGSRNAKLRKGHLGYLDASEGIHLLEIPTELDRSKGDIHAHGNPHYLLDPANAKTVAGNLMKRFCALDPAHCGIYEKNHAQFNRELDQKVKDWKAKLAPHKGSRIVSYHNSWAYFADAFDLKIDLHLEPKPGIPPTPNHLMGVIQTIKKENIKAVLAEPFVNKRTAMKVAADTGAKVVDVSYFPGG